MITPEPPTDSDSKPQMVALARGGQAVINGALVVANEPCMLEVSAGAYVLTGRALWRESMRDPHAELYFSIVEAGTDAERFAEARFRLFALLSQVVTLDRSAQAQRECAACSAALMSGDIKTATRSAARLASEKMAQDNAERARTAGRYQPPTRPVMPGARRER